MSKVNELYYRKGKVMGNKEVFSKGMAKVETKAKAADKKASFEKATREVFSVSNEFAKRGMAEFANLVKQKTAA